MQLPYIDNHRIVLFGKVTLLFKLGKSIARKPRRLSRVFDAFGCFCLQGFGGYLALKISAATEKLFLCTVAMAPITDFRLYSESSLIITMQRKYRACGHGLFIVENGFSFSRRCFLREVSRPSSKGGARLLCEARN